MSGLSSVERALGYKFRDAGLLKKALTLSSFDHTSNNESLECLGDALLTFIVAEKYYYENMSEGEITKKKQELISDEALRPVSEGLGLAAALIRDKGDTANKKAVPSAYEAVVAAIYLDGGLKEARKFALRTLTPAPDALNYVGELQELLQNSKKQLPVYEEKLCGTPQSPRHIVELTLFGRTFTGEGANFKEAKRLAAKAAYEFAQKSVK